MSVLPPVEEALFQAVLKRPMAQRNSYLKRECADDDALRRRIEERLAARNGSEAYEPRRNSEDSDEETLHLAEQEEVQPHAQIDR